MKCNLSRLVRCIVLVLVAVVCINVFVFLKSPQYAGGSVDDGLIRFAAQNGAGYTRQVTTTAAPVRLNSTSTCPGMEMKEPHNEGQFQAVSGQNLYIYSAYLDYHKVRVIALREMNSDMDQLYCHMWFQFKGKDPLVIAPAQVENMPEDHGRRFGAAYVLCHIPSQFENENPYAVSLVAGQQCSVATNILRVRTAGRITSRFTVCVTPFNYRYSRAYELVEMLEMNKLLGADKFVFYNHSTGPNVDRVLEVYSKSNEVEVHPWHLPMKVDTWPSTGDPEVHYFAQLAALNDCLFRHRNQSEYLVYEDLDEFIIPKVHETWSELLKENNHQNNSVSAFQFKCVFYRKEWPRPAKNYETSAQKYKSVILSYTQRETQYMPYGMRSKYIINPRLTTLVGVHNLWQNSGTVEMIPESVASLHHYRSWEKPHDPEPRVVDEIAVDKYGPRLVKVLEEVWSKLADIPMDIDIKTYGDHV